MPAGVPAFGELLRAVRERSGLSEFELGQRVGVTANTVRDWEEGTTTPKVLDLIPLRDVFGEDIYVALIHALTKE
jgi:transcriptional regulator with XRE-family HTH domain